MKTTKRKDIPQPSKKVAIFANWFRVGVIGLIALFYLSQLW